MTAFLQPTFSNTFPSMKILISIKTSLNSVLWDTVDRSAFGQIMICHYLAISHYLNQWYFIRWRIYGSLVLNIVSTRFAFCVCVLLSSNLARLEVKNIAVYLFHIMPCSISLWLSEYLVLISHYIMGLKSQKINDFMHGSHISFGLSHILEKDQ